MKTAAPTTPANSVDPATKLKLQQASPSPAAPAAPQNRQFQSEQPSAALNHTQHPSAEAAATQLSLCALLSGMRRHIEAAVKSSEVSDFGLRAA